MDISLIGNSALLAAIQQNLVSFPSQIPAFTRRPGGDTQERIAKLYFSLGWPVKRICERYGISRTMVQKLLADWRLRAVASGFIQDINPEELEALAHRQEECDESAIFHPERFADTALLVPSIDREEARVV